MIFPHLDVSARGRPTALQNSSLRFLLAPVLTFPVGARRAGSSSPSVMCFPPNDGHDGTFPASAQFTMDFFPWTSRRCPSGVRISMGCSPLVLRPGHVKELLPTTFYLPLTL